MKYPSLIAVLTLLSGCMPWIIRATPAVHGTIFENGIPVANADIYVIYTWREEPCHEATIAARTASDGSFSVKGTRGLGVVGYGDYVAGFTLCIRTGNLWHFGYHEGGMAYSPPRQVALHCELSASPTARAPPCHRS